jgi:hypothetical protein
METYETKHLVLLGYTTHNTDKYFQLRVYENVHTKRAVIMRIENANKTALTYWEHPNKTAEEWVKAQPAVFKKGFYTEVSP